MAGPVTCTRYKQPGARIGVSTPPFAKSGPVRKLLEKAIGRFYTVTATVAD